MKLLRITAIIFALMLLSDTQAKAQIVLTADEVIRMAMENNHDIIITSFAKEIAENSATPGNAGLLPTISTNAGITYNNSDTDLDLANFNEDGSISVLSLSGDGAESTNYSVSVDATYRLFDGFGNVYRFRSLKINEQRSEAEMKQVIEATLAKTLNIYIDIARLQQRLLINQESLNLSQERLERIRSTEAFGSATSTEVLQAEVDFKNDSSGFNQINLLLGIAKVELNELIGYSDTDYQVEDSIELSEFRTKEELIEKVEQNNPFIRINEFAQEDARLNVQLSRSNLFPVLDLNTGYGYYEEDNDLGQIQRLERTGFRAGITLRFNLFNGGRVNSDIQNSKIRQKQAEIQLNRTKTRIQSQFETVYLTYQNSLQNLMFEQSNIRLFEQNYQRAEENYQRGNISGTDLRTAQLNLIQAKNRINNLEYDIRQSIIQIKQLTGELVTEVR
ncbi:MAG: TolC family protein [Balneolales bacterium]|nr:TolC family protein [Balneolales bacterium]